MAIIYCHSYSSNAIYIYLYIYIFYYERFSGVERFKIIFQEVKRIGIGVKAKQYTLQE